MNKTKFMALTLSFAVAASSYAAAAAQDSEHWAHGSMERLVEMGILTGDDDGNLLPDNKITRAELFTMLNRAGGLSKMSGIDFSDVKSSAWYKNQTDMAVTAGYAAGYGDGTIHPEAFVTRAEAATMIFRMFYAQSGAKSDFSDSTDIPDWASEAVSELSASGVISGYEDGSFRPDEPITRAEVSSILDKAIGKRYVDRNDLKDETIDGNLIITASNYNLENITVNGNVYVTNTGESGELRFINCTINGYIYYGSNNTGSIVLDNSNLNSIISGGKSKIVLTGKSSAGSLYIKQGAQINAFNYDGSPIKKIYAKGETEINANAEDIEVNGKSEFKLGKGFTAQKLLLAEGADGSVLTVEGTVNQLESRAGATVNDKRISSGYKSPVTGENEKNGSYSYTQTGGKGSGGGGGGGGSSRPSSGSGRSDNDSYCINGISLGDGLTLSTPFDKDITEYSVYTEYDVSKIDICIDYTLGARVRINNVYVSAGEMHSIADIPHGSTTVLIELLDGLETLKTYTVNVHREYEASPEKLLELNELMRNTTDADAEAVKILAAMGDANIGDAIIVLTGKYKEEYDAEYNGEDLTQKQFTALVKKVNAANKDMLALSIGIKNDGGYVYKETVYKDSSGMYSVKLKYAALASSDNKKLAVYINGKKYESEAVNLNPLNGWTETELTIRLESGESELEVYAESVNDGNYGLLIKSAEISEDKLPVESKILLAKDFAKLKIYKINGNNSYIGNTNSSIGNAVLGGNIIFRFNSNDAQKATIKLKWSPNVKTVNFGTLAFFNPVKVYDVAKNEVCTEDMTEGIDYPAQSDAVINDMLTADDWNTGRGSWKDGQEKTWCETEIEVELSVGENILWFPAKMLGEYDADTETVKNGPYGFGNTLANGQSLIYSIEIIPESFELE